LVFADRSGSAKVGMGVDAKGEGTLTGMALQGEPVAEPVVVDSSSAPPPTRRR